MSHNEKIAVISADRTIKSCIIVERYTKSSEKYAKAQRLIQKYRKVFFNLTGNVWMQDDATRDIVNSIKHELGVNPSKYSMFSGFRHC